LVAIACQGDRKKVFFMAVRIFVAGGTFDKEYNEQNGLLFFKDSHVPDVLKTARCETAFEVRTLMMMDSLKMKDADRMMIAENCKRCEEKSIVITHGTDTMVETGKLLMQHIKDKTIVLTGAMRPFTFGSSDGVFNLGTAIASAKTLPPGIYIAMSGHLFRPDNCMKNRRLGKFERLH